MYGDEVEKLQAEDIDNAEGLGVWGFTVYGWFLDCLSTTVPRQNVPETSSCLEAVHQEAII